MASEKDVQDNDFELPDRMFTFELIWKLEAELYKIHQKDQYWLTRTCCYVDSCDGLILERRQFLIDYHGSVDPHQLSVFQWNIIPQALAKLKKYINCPDEALDWNFRKYPIALEITARYCDVICLQGVDHFKFLNKVMATLDYSGVFLPNPNSQCSNIEGNNGPDGCAIFYRNGKFKNPETYTKVFDENQMALLMLFEFEHYAVNHKICVVSADLDATQENGLSVLKELLDFIELHAKGQPVVLCGNFNFDPKEPGYKAIYESNLKLSSAYADCDIRSFVEEIEDEVEDLDEVKFSTEEPSEREPPYTTFKVKENEEIRKTTDYIFYCNDKYRVEAIWNVPTENEIGKNGIPSYKYPSDHFSLACNLQLKRS